MHRFSSAKLLLVPAFSLMASCGDKPPPAAVTPAYAAPPPPYDQGEWNGLTADQKSLLQIFGHRRVASPSWGALETDKPLTPEEVERAHAEVIRLHHADTPHPQP